ncbi:hypothetical protein [Planococcus beigongshangi]|uniref:hypothetical protein n=1 Tax=Planococcus beigongshangi TaxID=2782536 RepID=UPI00193B09B4|nr:hypothetical protein [Planococcus beigongshangi]
MNLDFNELIVPGIIEGFFTVAMMALPLILWIGLPAIISNIIFRSRDASRFGALLGFVALYTIGPFSTMNLF